MRSLRLGMLIVALGLWGFAGQPGRADEAARPAPDEAALLKNAEALVAAFQQGDAKAVAALWTADGDYIDEAGHRHQGREAIEKLFAALFAEHQGMKLRIDVAGLRFPAPDLAIEDGTTEVIPADGTPPNRARYTIVHVRKDGQWSMVSVRESPFLPPSNVEHLRGLEWLAGDWTHETDKGPMSQVSFHWAESQNFLVSSYATSFKNQLFSSGVQWIGWDPTAKHIRSWTFDADGGFGMGFWTQEGDRLVIKTSSILRDGKKVTATNIVTRIDPDTLTWQSRERTLDGKPLPDIQEIKLRRQK